MTFASQTVILEVGLKTIKEYKLREVRLRVFADIDRWNSKGEQFQEKKMIYQGLGDLLQAIGDDCPDVEPESFRHVVYMEGKDAMQFIGLKDRNGVEIYEGDIMEYYSLLIPRGDNPIKRVVVKWNNKTASYDNCFNGSVIGNIYENPDLIKDI